MAVRTDDMCPSHLSGCRPARLPLFLCSWCREHANAESFLSTCSLLCHSGTSSKGISRGVDFILDYITLFYFLLSSFCYTELSCAFTYWLAYGLSISTVRKQASFMPWLLISVLWHIGIFTSFIMIALYLINQDNNINQSNSKFILA